MKKIQLILAFVLAIFSLGHAQNASLEWGVNIESKQEGIKLLGDADGVTYAFAKKEQNYTVFVFDRKSMAKLAEKELVLPKLENKKVTIEALTLLNGKCVVLASQEQKDFMRIFAFTLNAKGDVESASKTLLSVELDKAIAEETIFRVSEDKTRLMVAQRKLNRKEKSQVIEANVFDEALNLVNSAENKISTKGNGERIKLSAINTDNNGDVYVMFNRQTASGALISYEVFHYTIEKQKFTYELSLAKLAIKSKKEIQIASAIFSVNAKGDLCVGGYYSEKTKSPYIPYALRGSYFMRIDGNTHEIAVSEVTPFDQETKLQVAGGDAAIAEKMDIPNSFEPRRLVNKDDGSVILISEFVVDNESLLTQYGTILITCFGVDGTVQWSMALPKAQVTMDTDKKDVKHYSFFSVMSNNKIYFVFNESQNIENVKTGRDIRKIMKEDIAESKPMVVELGLDGKGYSKKVLKDVKGGDVIMCPTTSAQVSESEVVLFGSHNKTSKIGKFKLQ